MNEEQNYSNLAFAASRDVSLGLKLKILFGSIFSQVGWALLAIGMIFVFVFVGNADFSDWYFNANSPQTEATILEIAYTNSEINNRTVVACYYAFKTATGKKYEGVSYTTGAVPQKGEKVIVNYLSNNPSYSRIQGMMKGMFPPWVLFVLIFPLIGLGFIVFNSSKSIKAIRLLQTGVITRGRMIGMKATNTTINNRPVMKLCFEFVALDGQTYQAYASTHLIENLIDEQEELLFYDKYNPTKAVMKDNLPGRPTLFEDGSLEDVKISSALIYLIVPLVALVEIFLFIRWMV